MPPTAQTSSNGSPVMDFTPVDYDRDVTLTPAGEWTAICSVKKSKTNEGGFPMLILEWKLEDTDDEDHKTYLGTTESDFVVFFPKGHKGARMGALRMRGLCEHMNIDLDTVPQGKISSWADLEELIEGLDKQRATIWTTIGKGRDNQPRTTVVYAAPGGAITSPSDDDEDEEEKPAARSAKGKPAAAKGKTARR
jgi:hypothetical protein